MGPTWGQIGSNVDPFELKWASLDPVESPNGFQTTTININTNNRFLLPRGGLTVCIYIISKLAAMRQLLPYLPNEKTTSNSSWPAAENLAYSPQQMLRWHRRRSKGISAHLEKHAPQMILLNDQMPQSLTKS